MINHNVVKSPDQRGPLPHNWWKFISILIEADWWYIEDLSRSFDEVLWSANTYVQSWSAFFFSRSADFPNYQKFGVSHFYINRIQQWPVTVCKVPSSIKVEIMPINIQPTIIKIIVRFSGRRLSYRVMSRITEVSQGDISKVLRRVHHISILPMGYVGIDWRRLHE